MTAIDLFQYEGQQVRTVIVDGEPWFVLADICAVLDIANPSNVAARIDEDALRTMEVIDSMGRTQRARAVDEGGLYEVILLSRKPEAKAFKRWVTHEVLPAIRKTGTYTTTPALPQSYAEALRELAATVEAKEIAEQRAAALQGPADAWGVMVSATGDYAVDEAAKILSRDPNIEIGRTRLFTYMAEQGWIYRHGPRSRWHAYQAQVDNGRLVQRMSAAFLNARTGDMEVPAPTIRVTPKGLEELHRRLGGGGTLVPLREVTS